MFRPKLFLSAGLLAGLVLTAGSGAGTSAALEESPLAAADAGSSHASTREQQFLAVPDPRLAEQDMRVLTAEPHIAGSPEDRKTADYVARKFREAGLEVEIDEYRVWMNSPAEASVDLVAPPGARLHGPTRERVEGDPYQDDPRVTIPFNAYSPSGDAEADVVYANYGRPEDFDRLKDMGIDVRGKILLVRYGENFRGVKSFMAQENGAAGVLMYSDPMDDGYFRGDVYPRGPWRPDTAVQRGTIEFGFEHPGDPTTPGFASLPSLPDSQRVPPGQSPDVPKVPTMPLSYHDAEPILRALGGPESPRNWQGALPFTYHIGPGPARVRLHIKQNYAYRTIWDVMGKVRGSQWPEETVIAGNHRDAWVYGAVDPVSGTVTMLQAARGIGALLKSGWRPRRTIVFASWDAEEQGLIGSTEWLEQHESQMPGVVAYFNTDMGASGPNFRAAAIPSLRNFLRDIARAVPSPKGGTLYQNWIAADRRSGAPDGASASLVGNLGSGSDFASFLDHSGVPATDIRSTGNYGVYHSVFDNFAWFKKFGDPDFLYVQEMARVFGLEVLRMADARLLPMDYQLYGREIGSYIEAARLRGQQAFGGRNPSFTAASQAAVRLGRAGAALNELASTPAADPERINTALRQSERALLLPAGLPKRPWFRHSIFAPADLKGYSASVIPGVNEAIERGDLDLAVAQLEQLTAALNRATEVLENAQASASPASGK